MLYFLIATVLMIGFLDTSARRSRIEMLRLDTRFKLFGIRDRLRALAIDGEIETDQWFDYFDTTLTKIIDLLPTMTVWRMALMLVHYREDETMERHSKELNAFLHAERNAAFLGLYMEFVHAVGSFILQRHRTLRLGLNTLRWVGRTSTKFDETKEEVAQIVSLAPETSTFPKYCTGH